MRLVTAASHREVKNYPNLLQALRWAQDAGAEFDLVAVGEGPRLAEHVRLAHDLGIAHRVEFMAPTTEVLDVMATADALVVASDFEGQPLVVTEALALGVPVIATAVGRVLELVMPAVRRVVPPGDPVALGRAIVELVTDTALRARLAAATGELNPWTIDDVITAHLELYAELRSR